MQKINTVGKNRHTFAEEGDSKSGNKEWQIVYPKMVENIPKKQAAMCSCALVPLAMNGLYIHKTTWWTFEPISINSNANIEFIPVKVTESKFEFISFLTFRKSNRKMTNSNLIPFTVFAVCAHNTFGFPFFLSYFFSSSR